MTAAKTTRKPRTRKTQAIVPMSPWMDDMAALSLKMRAREIADEPPVFWHHGELYHRSDGGSAMLCHQLDRERRTREDENYQRVLPDWGRLPDEGAPWKWYRDNPRPSLVLVADPAPLPVIMPGTELPEITGQLPADIEGKVAAFLSLLDEDSLDVPGAEEPPQSARQGTVPGPVGAPPSASPQIGPGTQDDNSEDDDNALD